MQILKGVYTDGIIYADILESAAYDQIRAMCNLPIMENSSIRIMPDAHPGTGCTIGTTLTIKNKKVIPNLVGVDIGCGMFVVKLKEKRIDLPKLDSVIRKNVPSGFNIRDKEHKYNSKIDLEELLCKKTINIEKAKLSLGSLGGGNHFIEVDKDEETGDLYLVIHTGSRHLGVQVASYYQKEAYNSLMNDGLKEEIANMVAELKSKHREKEIESEIKRIKQERSSHNVSKTFAFCENSLFDDYIHDMKITQEYATLNRLAIGEVILHEMHLHSVESFTTIHNYIETNPKVGEDMILRKGAVSAYDGERLIIPINMRDGSLICTGKGNKQWNYSAPHGAGRLMSRSQAKQQFSLNEYKKTMKEAEIFTTSVDSGTLDECPMAYKPMQNIIDNIQETVTIDKIIKPIYNFKASEQE